MFKLLTGRAPYADGFHNTLMKKMTALATKPVPEIRSVRPDVLESVAKVVDRMLDREPSNRYDSASEVAEELAVLSHGADLQNLLRQALASDDPAPQPAPLSLIAPRSERLVRGEAVKK